MKPRPKVRDVWEKVLRDKAKVLARGKMNSCLIEFIDNNQREVVSRNALKKK